MNRAARLTYAVARIADLRALAVELREASTIDAKFSALALLDEFGSDDFISTLSGNDIVLGRTPIDEPLAPEGTWVTIPSKSLNGNLSIAARIRTGKTYLLMLILCSLHRLGYNWLAFERKKSFRQLVEKTGAIVCKPEDLKHNLLRPPNGVPFRTHLMRICSIFAGTQMLTQVSEHDLYEIILGNQASFQREHPNKYLDLYQVRILLAETIKRLTYKEQRMTNLIVGNADRWNALCTYLGEVYSDLLGTEIYDLLQNNNVIVDCSELSNAMTAFLFFEFLSILTISRLCLGLTERNALLHVTAMDEFEDVIGQVNMTGHSLLVDHWRRDRESNLGKVIVNHSADYHQRYDNQSITNTITTNTFYHIVGPMGNLDELKKVGRRLSFEERHYDWLTGDGERRFVLASPTHPPVCFVADELELPDGYDEQAHESRKIAVLSQYPSEPVPAARKEYALAEVFRRDFKMPRTMDQVRQAAQTNSRSDALRFLSAIKDNPFSSYTDLRSTFNSTATAQKAKTFCLESDWLKEATIIEGKSRPSLYFHITESGRAVLIEEGLLRKQDTLHSIKHVAWAAKCIVSLADRLKGMGYSTTIDKGDSVDLCVGDDSSGNVMGIEFNYTTSVSYELGLLRKELGRGISRIVLVVIDFEEVKKNSFRMTVPKGKITAFHNEIEQSFLDLKPVTTILTWEEAMKWIP